MPVPEVPRPDSTEAASTEVASTEAPRTEAATTEAASPDAGLPDAGSADAAPAPGPPGGDGHPPPPEWTAPVAPPASTLDPPTLDLGVPPPAPPPGQPPIGSASSGGSGGPPPVPPAPQGVSAGSGRTWILVALGVGLLVVIGVVALAVGLVRGADPDAIFAATEATVPDPGGDTEAPGTDTALDELWVACADGDMAACDDLYTRSEVGSEYEDFGRTCGRRVEDAGLCVDAFSGDADATDDGDAGLPEEGPDAAPPGSDSAMDELWAACAAEDWQACDDLFFESEFGSVYEEFGRTCGYRVDGCLPVHRGHDGSRGRG